MNVLTTEIKKTDRELTNDEYLAKYFPGMSAFDVHHKFRGRVCNMQTALIRLKQILDRYAGRTFDSHTHNIGASEYEQLMELVHIISRGSDE